MWILSLIFVVLQTQPVDRVIVDLTDGRQVVIENPEFGGFMRGTGANAVLTYRRQLFHGLMPAATISRIDFGPYESRKPFTLKITLRNGQQIEVEPERQDYLTIRGNTALGPILVKHPDPVSAPLRLSTRKPDRRNDLTIQSLEFQAPSE